MATPLLPTDPVMQWAGLGLDRPRVMGILNVTPDSFSDGGHRTGAQAAIEAGLAMIAEGADIVDVGGESTRPGAAPVPPEVEQARVVPVIAALAAAGHCISVDTRNAATMQAALAAGARIVNDVTALAYDKLAAGLVARLGCPVVLMHMRGAFATMYAEARYGDVVAEVRAELEERIAAAIQAGIRPEQIAIDPGSDSPSRRATRWQCCANYPTCGTLAIRCWSASRARASLARLPASPTPAGGSADRWRRGCSQCSEGRQSFAYMMSARRFRR